MIYGTNIHLFETPRVDLKKRYIVAVIVTTNLNFILQHYTLSS